MTTTSERSTALGVFADNSQADKAIDDLRNAGFGYSQIRLVERGTGGFLDSFKNLFMGQETTSANTSDDLMKQGVPEQDARYYHSQLDAGRAIVVVNAANRLEQAMSILHQDGAYDINARLRTAEANLPTGTSQPDVKASQLDAEAPQSPTGSFQTPAGAPQPAETRSGSYNPNTSPTDHRIPGATYQE